MFRKSIFWKTVLGLFLIFILGGLFLYWVVARQEESSRKDQIIRDLNSLKANSQVYIRHLLVLDGQNNDEESYRQVAQEMVQELYQVNGCLAAAYTNEGELLYTMRTDLFESAEKEDLRRAMDGTAAFTVFYPGTEQMAVTFSMPVIVVDETVGILRFWVDYSSLYRQGKETANMVLKSCMTVFLLIFAVALLMLSGILRPIRRLSKISRMVTEGLEKERIDGEMLDRLAEGRGSDEVGQLAGDMETMLRLLDEQFAGMKEDKARILELLKSRQEFYNNVTHELKTPLTVIQGYSELLETAGEDEELRVKAISHIRNESDRLYRMVLQLLDLARYRQPEEKKPVNLNVLVKSVADTMELKASRYGISFCLEMEPNLRIMAEEERVRQVFVNLFDNAIKYGRPAAAVTVTGRRLSDMAGNVQIQVINAGFLSDQDQEKIFEPFYRVSKEASREMGSSGLGLPLCRQIMEEQGGRITARCEKGTVIFELCFEEGREQKQCVAEG